MLHHLHKSLIHRQWKSRLRDKVTPRFHVAAANFRKVLCWGRLDEAPNSRCMYYTLFEWLRSTVDSLVFKHIIHVYIYFERCQIRIEQVQRVKNCVNISSDLDSYFLWFIIVTFCAYLVVQCLKFSWFVIIQTLCILYVYNVSQSLGEMLEY